METKKKVLIGVAVLLILVFTVIVGMELAKGKKEDKTGNSQQTTTAYVEATTKDGIEIKTNNKDEGFGDLIPLDPVKK